ncbi:MAG: membrane-spanning protein [Clostridiales bacterium]|nr:membrane-spanning protein [Clostridiales bacterium]
MNYRKYRLCLAGLIVVALVCGIFVYMKNMKESEMPADGMLVKNGMDIGDETEKWA